MLLTVTNASASITLNAVDSYLGFAATADYPATPGVTAATGGSRKYPLPYPFDWVVLAPSGSKQLPVRARDWRHRHPSFSPLTIGEEFNQLIQNGTITVSLAAEATDADMETQFFHAV